MHHLHIDKYGDLKSPVHAVDPRVKIIAAVTIILFVVFTDPRLFAAFFLYAAMIFTLAILSRVPIFFIFRKSLVVIPFSFMVAAFLPFMAGRDGLMIFWNVVIKSYLSVLTIIIFTASTKFSVLLKAMEKLKIPKLFIMIISFMYRYLFVSVDELMHMAQAKRCRSVGGSRWFHAKTLANMIGSLFIRSYERGEAVYLAMRSRGFNGSMRTLYEFNLRSSDMYFLAVITLFFVSVRLLTGKM